MLTLGSSLQAQSCGDYSVQQEVCLKVPGNSNAGIWLRDSLGQRLGKEWPNRSVGSITAFDSACRFAEIAREGQDSAWVSSVVLSARSNCTSVEPPSQPVPDSNSPVPDLVCSGSSDCERQAAQAYARNGKRKFSYRQAREYMFQEIDNVDGAVITVYSQIRKKVPSSGVPNSNEVNTEHTWPQSKLGSSKSESRTDLYHLFPTISRVNSTCSNYPFTDCSGGGETAI